MTKIFIFLLFFSYSKIILSQEINTNVESVIANSVNSDVYTYEPKKTIKKFYDTPNNITLQRTPIIVQTDIKHYKDNKFISNRTYIFNCENEEMQTTTGFISLKNVGNTIEKNIMKKLCGVKQDDGHWFHFISQTNLLETFFNIETLKKVNSPIDGIYLEFAAGNFDYKDKKILQLTLNERREIIFDCNSRNFYMNKISGNSQPTQGLLKNNSDFEGIRHNICFGVFKNLVAQSNTSPPNSNLRNNIFDDAKKKCSDLGLKSGTEGFGKCVLQLSK